MRPPSSGGTWEVPRPEAVAADVLVGRERERERLGLVLERARAGRSAAIVVCGEPGVGKTALLRDLADQASDFLVLSARGVETEAQLAFAGLAELFDPVLDLRFTLPAPRRAALESALQLAPPSPGDRFATYAAALGLLAEAAERAPVLAVIDDAHWFDPSSLAALRFCARRLRDDRVGLVVSTRDHAVDLIDRREESQLRLAGLDAGAVARLLEHRAPVPVPDIVAGALHAATAGNPLALVELVRLLDDAQLGGARALPDPLPLGPAMQRAYGSQIQRLPAATRTALLIAAADESGELDVLARALRLRRLDLAALESAETAGLVSLSQSRIEFRHPLLRAAAYHGAAAPARRDAHVALAEASPRSPSQARRAWHLAAATIEPDEQIAAELEAAAFDAAQRAAPDAAGRAMETAARLTPDAAARTQRLLGAARLFHLAGVPERALRLLDDALSAAKNDPLARADVQHARAQVQGLRGAPAATRSLLVAEAERVEPHDPGRAAGMLVDAALASTMLGEPRETLRLAERSVATAEAVGSGLRVMAAFQLGMAHIMCGNARSGLRLLEQARPLLHGNDLSLWGFIGPTVAMAHVWVGHYEEARRSMIDLLAQVREQGALSALPWALYTLAVVEYYLGDWPAARALATESIARAEELDQPAIAGVPSVTLAVVAAGQGQFAEAREHTQRARRSVDEFGIAALTTAGGWALGLTELAAGRHDEALAVLGPTGDFTLQRGLEEPGVVLWAQDLAEAYIRAGRLADADATLRVLQSQATRAANPLAQAGASRCRGLLADDDFASHFQRALAWHDRVPVPFERARTELCFGERLRRARRRTDARGPLGRALRGFEALGAEPWAERARRELAATGVRARKREPSSADQLTPQELQVARLVVEGATNKEAASALFVTPKTIETHLYHVYRKLGIRSRTELVRRLGETQKSRTVHGGAP